MSNALVSINKSQLPAHLRADAEQARAVAKEFASGVTAGFPIISYRGKVWRVKKSGEEVAYVDRKGNPLPNIEIVLVRSNPMPSKTYYKGKWQEGDNSPPDCWSSDGIKPDAAVQHKQNNVCATCPRNAWGSRVTDQGKKGRECSDVRRMAVVFYSELRKKGADAHLFLMRVPPASLNPLKDYVEKSLAPANVNPYAVVTEVGFDAQASHPKLTFRVAEDDNDNAIFLSEDEYELVKKLRESDDAHRILSEEPEYAEAGTTGGDEGTVTKAAEETPAPASAPKKQKARPVDEEDVEVTQAPRAAKAPEPEDDEVESEDEDDAPPPPKKRKPAKSSAPTPSSEDESPAPAPATPAKGKGGFDEILDSLLG